jgi:signal transduction histidine kinase
MGTSGCAQGDLGERSGAGPDGITDRSCDDLIVTTPHHAPPFGPPTTRPEQVRGSLAFRRRDEGRVLAGVAGGFADRHGVDVTLVRGALVVLTVAGGLGLVLYVIGAVFAQPPAEPHPVHPLDRQRNLAVAFIAGGLLLIVRSTGLWLGDAVMVPLVTVVAGLVMIGVVRPEVGERPWQAFAGTSAAEFASGRRARTRLVAGAVLVAFGLVLVGARQNASNSVRVGTFATALTVVGVAILVGPWLTKLAQEAAAERRERIRVEEREAMAAHLHDSVLQTLALIQRTADDPRRIVTLARQQERELREWLYGAGDMRAPTDADMSLAAVLRRAAAEVEASYHVRVEVVVVGDATMDDAADALAAATREACVNAAKHSGVGDVSVYAEIRDGLAEVFVRDRGCGFDRSRSAPDRRGIAQSIEARIERVGGSAEIDTSPGDGTEVHLRVPLTPTGSIVSGGGR